MTGLTFYGDLLERDEMLLRRAPTPDTVVIHFPEFDSEEAIEDFTTEDKFWEVTDNDDDSRTFIKCEQWHEDGATYCVYADTVVTETVYAEWLGEVGRG